MAFTNSFSFFSLLMILTIWFSFSNAQNSAQDYLDVHNAARALVGVANITWDNTVATYALNYANSRKSDCNLVHSSGPYGENLAKGSSGTFTGISAVNLWVNEKQNYDYNTNSCINGGQCLHYTQVVWSNSVHLGCARVQCTNGWWFVTCNYDPPGNFVGQKPY
jgi:pathogenesis-related protein 1